jgi:hypothetical protein
VKRLLPFLPEFGPLISSGLKTATARKRRYAAPGEVLHTPWGPVEVLQVEEMELGRVAHELWQAEGVRSPRAFVETWERCFPEAPFDPAERVFVHHFRLHVERASEGANA